MHIFGNNKDIVRLARFQIFNGRRRICDVDLLQKVINELVCFLDVSRLMDVLRCPVSVKFHG